MGRGTVKIRLIGNLRPAVSVVVALVIALATLLSAPATHAQSPPPPAPTPTPSGDEDENGTEGASVPTPPTGLSLSVSSDDLTLTYSRSESPHRYQFELHRATSRYGTYSRVTAVSDSFSPAYFRNQSAGYWYRTRGRNCETLSRTRCGNWSGWSNRVEIEPPPMPPTELSLSVSSDDLTLAYSRSESPHLYQFELHRAKGQYDTYSRVKAVNDYFSPAYFNNQSAGYWYRTRGRNCETISRTRCGNWSNWSNRVEIEEPPPMPPTGLSLSVSSDDLTLTYSKSESPHRYEFELRQATSQYGTYSRVTAVNDSYSPANFDDQARDTGTGRGEGTAKP